MGKGLEILGPAQKCEAVWKQEGVLHQGVGPWSGQIGKLLGRSHGEDTDLQMDQVQQYKGCNTISKQLGFSSHTDQMALDTQACQTEVQGSSS